MFPSCEETVNGLFCKKSLITFFSVLVHKYIKFNNVPILIKKKSYYKEKNLLIIILQSKVIDNNFFTYIPPLMTMKYDTVLYVLLLQNRTLQTPFKSMQGKFCRK